MNPPALSASNIIPTDLIFPPTDFSPTDRDAAEGDNRPLRVLSGVRNNGLCLKPGLTYLDNMPGEILQLIAQATPLIDRQSLANALNRGNGRGTYIDKEVKLSEFIINRVPEISTIDDFRTALREIRGLLRSDQGRSLEALSGSMLNLTDQNGLGTAIVEFLNEARPHGDRYPSLKKLINVLAGVDDIHRIMENFTAFIFRQIESENNCLKLAIRYGLTEESVLHDLEHHCLELLSNEEVEESQTQKDIADKYGIYEACVLELLEQKFVEYRAGVEILNGYSVDNVAARYNIITPLGRKRLAEYHAITREIMAGGNCFRISQRYAFNLRNKPSRIAMELLSIKYVAGPAVLTSKNCRAVAQKYGILTRKGREKLEEYLLLPPSGCNPGKQKMTKKMRPLYPYAPNIA